jgi:hypothetical protein
MMASPALDAFIEQRDAPTSPEGGGEAASGRPPAPAAPQSASDPVGDDVVARVRAKQAAKAQAAPAAPAGTPAGQANAPAPAATPEPTYSAAQLREVLDSDTALDRLFDLGVDVVKLHERMVARASTPREVRAVNDAVKELETKFTKRLGELEQTQQQQLVADERAEFEEAVTSVISFFGGKAEYPFLAVETADEQRARVVRAASDLVESGEATGTDSDIAAIAKLAEDAARKHASRYPGVRPVAVQEPAVGAGNQGTASAGPATLSGSLGGETSGSPGEVPPFGTKERRQHLLRVASRLGL